MTQNTEPKPIYCPACKNSKKPNYMWFATIIRDKKPFRLQLHCPKCDVNIYFELGGAQ